jgi:hypothetical protein
MYRGFRKKIFILSFFAMIIVFPTIIDNVISIPLSNVKYFPRIAAQVNQNIYNLNLSAEQWGFHTLFSPYFTSDNHSLNFDTYVDESDSSTVKSATTPTYDVGWFYIVTPPTFYRKRTYLEYPIIKQSQYYQIDNASEFIGYTGTPVNILGGTDTTKVLAYNFTEVVDPSTLSWDLQPNPLDSQIGELNFATSSSATMPIPISIKDLHNAGQMALIEQFDAYYWQQHYVTLNAKENSNFALKPYVMLNVSKFFQNNSEVYMQTNTAETLTIKSPILQQFIVEPLDNITLKFQVNCGTGFESYCNHAITLKLKLDNVVEDSIDIVPENNTQFGNLKILYRPSDEFKANNFEISGILNGTEQFILGGLSINRLVNSGTTENPVTFPLEVLIIVVVIIALAGTPIFIYTFSKLHQSDKLTHCIANEEKNCIDPSGREYTDDNGKRYIDQFGRKMRKVHPKKPNERLEYLK